MLLHFNPRSLAGATAGKQSSLYVSVIFQSTLPRGSDRPACCFEKGVILYFNPRSLAGATPFLTYLSPYIVHFNPRSLAGATARCALIPFLYLISIHAPSRERLTSPHYYYFPKIFQSTLPRGSDRSTTRTHTTTIISIHAPSRERLCFNVIICLGKGFQSTLPRGSD